MIYMNGMACVGCFESLKGATSYYSISQLQSPIASGTDCEVYLVVGLVGLTFRKSPLGLRL